tara:strand:- start:155 stop:577 length:423 start_codon:yes stop_codon:yes gene_type:complete
MVVNLLEKWEKEHFIKVLSEIKSAGIDFSLNNLDAIVEQTSFKVRSKNQPDECPYYPSKGGCHDLNDLNCFLCACPNYDSKSFEGGCKIESSLGGWHYHKNLPTRRVWDCSGCFINHSSGEAKDYIKENFDKLKIIFDSI